MIVIGCDPGTTQTALVVFDGAAVLRHEILPNDEALDCLSRRFVAAGLFGQLKGSVLVLEQVESFGMSVGREVFETVFWTGRFAEAWSPMRFDRLPRRIIKQHICHTARATDANIRTELLDRFGGPEKAVGKKAAPGPLFGIKSHCWAALAVAVTWYDQHGTEDLIRPGIAAEF